MAKSYSSKHRKSSYKLPLVKIGLIVLGLAAIGLAVSELTNTTHLLHKAGGGTSTIQPVTSSTPTTANTPNDKVSGDKNNAGTASSSPSSQPAKTIPLASLISPYGTFVSNHSPSLSGNGAPSLEESVCTSNPGVSCYIEFTKAGTTKKLPAQVTGSDGSTSWEWDVKKAGLATGDWSITAVVTSGSNSKTKQDSIDLTVAK